MGCRLTKRAGTSWMSDANSFSIRDAGPLEGLRPLSEREIFDDPAVTEHEAICKSSANPFGRVFQANPSVEICNDFVSIHQESLGLASPFRPSPTAFRDVRLHFRDATIGACCRKSLRLNAHNLRVKILNDCRHVITIDRSEELLERFSCGFHGLHYRHSGILRGVLATR
jgi:hypothetical protein